MERYDYKEDTKPTEAHLDHAETTKADAIVNRFLAVSHEYCGILYGLSVSVNALDNTKVDMAYGEAYTATGERMYVSPSATPTGQALANYLLGTVNFVMLKYVETYNLTIPALVQRGTGLSFRTAIDDSWVVEVLTEAAYNALSTVEKNKRVICSKVTAQGAGVPLGSADVQNAILGNKFLQASSPTALTGVRLGLISETCSEGTATLDWDVTAQMMRWSAPGDGFGAWVAIPADGTYTLASATISMTIVVTATHSALPVANTTESVTVASIYTRDIRIESADDVLHRNLKGSGTVTSTNPHGLTQDDIGADNDDQLIDHQDIQHSNGIEPRTSTGTGLVSIVAGPPDTLAITAPVGDAGMYVNGHKVTQMVNTTLSITAGSAYMLLLYQLYVDSAGNFASHLRVQSPTSAAVNVDGVQLINIDSNKAAGAYNLDYNNIVGVDYLSWDGGPLVNVTAGGVVRLWDSAETTWIDFYVLAGALPGVGPLTDAYTVLAPLDTEMYFEAGLVNWNDDMSSHGFPVATDDTLGYGTLLTNYRGIMFDKRLFGTLGEENVRDDLMEDRMTNPWDRFRADGVIDFYTAAPPNFDITNNAGVPATFDLNTGGFAWIGGQKVTVEPTAASVNYTNGTINYAYIDASGVAQSCIEADLATVLENPVLLLERVDVAGGGAITSETLMYMHLGHLDECVAPIVSPSTRFGQFTGLAAAVAWVEAFAAAVTTRKLKIRMRAGSYVVGDVDLPIGVDLEGEGSETIIVKNTNTYTIKALGYNRISNFFMNLSAVGAANFGIVMEGSEVVVDHVKFEGALAAADGYAIGIGDAGGGWKYDNCRIQDCVFNIGSTAVKEISNGTLANLFICNNVIGSLNTLDFVSLSGIAMLGGAVYGNQGGASGFFLKTHVAAGVDVFSNTWQGTEFVDTFLATSHWAESSVYDNRFEQTGVGGGLFRGFGNITDVMFDRNWANIASNTSSAFSVGGNTLRCRFSMNTVNGLVNRAILLTGTSDDSVISDNEIFTQIPLASLWPVFDLNGNATGVNMLRNKLKVENDRQLSVISFNGTSTDCRVQANQILGAGNALWSGISISGDELDIRNNILSNFDISVAGSSAIRLGGSGSNNTIWGNKLYDITGTQAIGIHVDVTNASSVTVKRNRIMDFGTTHANTYGILVEDSVGGSDFSVVQNELDTIAGVGIYVGGIDRAYIDRNEVREPEFRAIEFDADGAVAAPPGVVTEFLSVSFNRTFSSTAVAGNQSGFIRIDVRADNVTDTRTLVVDNNSVYCPLLNDTIAIDIIEKNVGGMLLWGILHTCDNTIHTATPPPPAANQVLYINWPFVTPNVHVATGNATHVNNAGVVPTFFLGGPAVCNVNQNNSVA